MCTEIAAERKNLARAWGAHDQIKERGLSPVFTRVCSWFSPPAFERFCGLCRFIGPVCPAWPGTDPHGRLDCVQLGAVRVTQSAHAVVSLATAHRLLAMMLAIASDSRLCPAYDR
jgi:hypothetical protein